MAERQNCPKVAARMRRGAAVASLRHRSYPSQLFHTWVAGLRWSAVPLWEGLGDLRAAASCRPERLCSAAARTRMGGARRRSQEPDGSRISTPAAAALALRYGLVQAPRGPADTMWNNQAETENG